MKKYQYLAYVLHDLDDIGGVFKKIAISSSKKIENKNQREWALMECERQVDFKPIRVFMTEVD